MKRTNVYRLVAIAALIIVLFILTAPMRGISPSAPVELVANDDKAFDYWPLSKTWRWTFQMDRGDEYVSLERGSIRTEVASGAAPFIPSYEPLPDISALKDRRSAILGVREPLLGGAVTAQFINLKDLAIPAESKEPLRLLLSLKIAGSAAPITGEGSILQGDELSGYAVNPKPAWKEDICHIMTIYTIKGNEAQKHFIFMQKNVKP